MVMLVGSLLAAGLSTRFEGPTTKLLTPFRGKALIEHSLESFRASGIATRSVVVGRSRIDRFILDTETILRNEFPSKGIASSVSIAAKWAELLNADALIIGLGDQPLVGGEAWVRVANSFGAPIVVATYQGRRRNPVKLSRETFGLLPVDGDIGAKALFELLPDDILEVECDGEPFDIDTVEDLKNWNY